MSLVFAIPTSTSAVGIAGCIGYNTSTTNTLYVSNGTTWQDVSQPDNISTSVTGITFTCSGTDLGLTGSLYLQKHTVGTINFVMLDLVFNSTITTTAAENWACAAATIPAAYRPANDLNFPGWIGGNTANSYFTIKATGAMQINLSAPSGLGSTLFDTFSCVFHM